MLIFITQSNTLGGYHLHICFEVNVNMKSLNNNIILLVN